MHFHGNNNVTKLTLITSFYVIKRYYDIVPYHIEAEFLLEIVLGHIKLYDIKIARFTFY